MNNPNNALVIGLITKPHGIKGELCIQYYADSPFLLKAPIFLLSPNDVCIDVQTKNYKIAKNHIILTLNISNDRNEAETLRNYEICIDPIVMQDFLKKHSSTKNISNTKEEVFVYQLLNLNVYNSLSNKKEYLGIIKNVDFIASQEIWTIITPNNKEILFPAVPNFVEEINLEKQEVIITPPKGLIEIYTEN